MCSIRLTCSLSRGPSCVTTRSGIARTGKGYCTEFGEIDTLTAYIDILDQSGRVLASSQASDSNFLRLELAGGVPHYVRVVAGDTMATTIKYHLVGHEAND